jgi:hypothetical protein
MRVAAYALGSIKEPYASVQHEELLCIVLRPGSFEAGPQRSKM